MAEIRDVPGQAIETQACVVYDRRSGTVVHTHTFVPADPATPARARSRAHSSWRPRRRWLITPSVST
jgi:hypothetical protein